MVAQPNSTRLRWCTGYALVFIAVALVLVALISAASAQQTWYLGSTRGIGSTYYMYDTWGQYGYIDIPANGEIIWITEDFAHHTITFNDGDWTLIFRGESGGSKNNRFNATLGSYAGGVFTPVTQTLIGQYSGSGNYESFYINDPDGFTVSEGDYLALQIQNRENFALNVDCYYESAQGGGGSGVTSPAGSCDYPYPEFSTVMLFGVGLLALVGYVGYRGRRSH
jgi:hypothetical protein